MTFIIIQLCFLTVLAGPVIGIPRSLKTNLSQRDKDQTQSQQIITKHQLLKTYICNVQYPFLSMVLLDALL